MDGLKVKQSPPPIPTQPCFKCGVLTNETQSVHGVGHYDCFLTTTGSSKVPISVKNHGVLLAEPLRVVL